MAFIGLIIALPALASPDWTIDNSTNSVYVNDSKAYISVSPHTLKESGDIIINLRSKVYTGNIDVVFGFNTTEVKPTSAALYDFGTQKYKDVSTAFDKVNHNFGGMNTWYYRKNISVVAGTDYRLRVSVEVPYLHSQGKYWVAIKPSAETIAQSITNGHLYYLDPWWNSTWMYKIDDAIANSVRPYQLSLNISNSEGINNVTHVFCNNHCNADFSDLRFTLDNSTSLPYWIENSTTGKVWVNVTANGTVNLYYGNSAATSASNGTNTFAYFDDFEGGLLSWTNNGGTWANNAGYRKQTSTTGAAYKHSYISVGLTDYIVHAKFKVPTGWSTYGREGLVTEKDAGTGNYWHVGCLMYNDKSQSVILIEDLNWNDVAALGFTAQLNTWYSVDMLRQANVQKVSIQPIGTGIIWQSQTALTSRTNTIAGLGGGYDNEIWFDDFYVRKYISPEMTWAAWGSEQNSLISSWGNNYTNDQNLTFSLNENTNIRFNLSKIYTGDSISWFVNSVNQSNGYDNISVNFNTVGTTNITAQVTNATLGTVSVVWLVTLNTQLLTPANGSTIYSVFPPSSPDITFSWTGTGIGYYRLLISDDQYFNHVVGDYYLYDETKTTSLLAEKSYWWKVRSYNEGGDPGEWTAVFNFSVVSNFTIINVTGIHGVVYEILNTGSYSPVSSATVYIRNEAANWSDTQITGSNGYYLFSNLSNSTTYYLYAKKKDYQDSATEYVTTVPGTVIVRNILMKPTEPTYFEPDRQYVKFTVQNLWGTKYSGVTATVYKGDDAVASDSGTTDSMGSISFYMYKTQKYRMTFINASAGINREITIYPKDTEYIIIIAITDNPWQEYPVEVKDTLHINVTKSNGYINVTYLDELTETTNMQVYVSQTNASNPYTQKTIDSWNVVSSNMSHSFAITNYEGQQYLVNFVITHTTFGTVKVSYVVIFPRETPYEGIPPVALNYFAIFSMIFIGGIFTAATVKMGVLIVPGMGWIYLFLGFFEGMDTTQITTALIVVSVLGVLYYLKESSRSEGYS